MGLLEAVDDGCHVAVQPASVWGQKVVVELGWEFPTADCLPGQPNVLPPSAYGLVVTLTAWRWPEPEHALPPWKRPQIHILTDSLLQHPGLSATNLNPTPKFH
jgi:hypothetical protein